MDDIQKGKEEWQRYENRSPLEKAVNLNCPSKVYDEMPKRLPELQVKPEEKKNRMLKRLRECNSFALNHPIRDSRSNGYYSK